MSVRPNTCPPLQIRWEPQLSCSGVTPQGTAGKAGACRAGWGRPSSLAVGDTVIPGIQEGPVSPEAVYHGGLIGPVADICLLAWATSSACLS